MTIPETIFFDDDGRPVAHYSYNAPEHRVVAVRVDASEYPGFVLGRVQGWVHDASRESESESTPVAVARYRTGARTLTAAEVTKMLAVVELRLANPERLTQPAVAIPMVLQRFVPPGEGARHVTTFMLVGPNVICETFQCAYHEAYSPRHTASADVASAELWELGDGPRPEPGIFSANAQRLAGTVGEVDDLVTTAPAAAESAATSPPGITWEPAAPPAKELYLRQTLLKLLNTLRREQGVQIIGIAVECIFPAAAGGGGKADDAPIPLSVPVLTGAFDLRWAGQEARAPTGAADGLLRPFFTPLPALSAVSAGIEGSPGTGRGASAAVPASPARIVDEEQAGLSPAAAAAAATTDEEAGSGRSADVEVTTSAGMPTTAGLASAGVAVSARGNNPTPQPGGTNAALPSAHTPTSGTAPEGAGRGDGDGRSRGGGGGGGGAGAGISARRRFEAEFLHTSSSERVPANVSVTSSGILVGGSGSFAAYANNDPGTSSFRSPRTGRHPGGGGSGSGVGGERYGIHSTAAWMMSSGGGAQAQRRPGTSAGEVSSTLFSASLGRRSRGGGVRDMDTTTRGHSEAKVWARGVPHASKADDALRASASTLLQSGRDRMALDGPLANESGSRRDKVAVPMIAQLSRRLEEVRRALASELEGNASLRLEIVGAKDTANRLVAAARDAEEELASTTRTLGGERAEASGAAAAAAQAALVRDTEVEDLTARLAESTTAHDYLRDRLNGERDEVLGVQGELRSLLDAERAALREAHAEREVFERESGTELEALRTECADLKITNEALLRDARRMNQEAKDLRMDNLRLCTQHEKVARLGLLGKSKAGRARRVEADAELDAPEEGGPEGEDLASSQKRLNKQHLNPDELSDLLHGSNERYLAARLVNRCICNNLEVLKQIYHHYAMSEISGGEWGSKVITPRELVILVRDCKLLEAGVGASKLTPTAVDQIFVKVNYNRRNSNHRKGDNAMDFHEFTHALVRTVTSQTSHTPLSRHPCRASPQSVAS